MCARYFFVEGGLSGVLFFKRFPPEGSVVGNRKTVGFAVGKQNCAFACLARFEVADDLTCAVVFVFDDTNDRDDIPPFFECSFCGGDLRFSSVDNNQRRKLPFGVPETALKDLTEGGVVVVGTGTYFEFTISVFVGLAVFKNNHHSYGVGSRNVCDIVGLDAHRFFARDFLLKVVLEECNVLNVGQCKDCSLEA